MARTKKTATKNATPVIVRSLDMPSLEKRVYNMDGAKIRNYDLFSLEKRIYDLEEGGTPGPTPTNNPIVHWDFTKATDPLIDEINGYVATLGFSPTINSDGVHIAEDNQSIILPKALLMLDATYEITFGAFSLAATGSNARLFVTRPIEYSGQSENPTCGFCYSFGENNVWGVYDTTNGWQLSEVSNKDIFNNGTLKIYVDILGKWHIYTNGELIYATPLAPLIQQTIFSIGSGAATCEDAYIKDIKIYRGEH